MVYIISRMKLLFHKTFVLSLLRLVCFGFARLFATIKAKSRDKTSGK